MLPESLVMGRDRVRGLGRDGARVPIAAGFGLFVGANKLVGGLAREVQEGMGMMTNTETTKPLNEYLVAIEAYDLGRWWVIEKRRVSAESEAQAVELLNARGVCGRVGRAERIRSEAEIDAMLAE